MRFERWLDVVRRVLCSKAGCSCATPCKHVIIGVNLQILAIWPVFDCYSKVEVNHLDPLFAETAASF